MNNKDDKSFSVDGETLSIRETCLETIWWIRLGGRSSSGNKHATNILINAQHKVLFLKHLHLIETPKTHNRSFKPISHPLTQLPNQIMLSPLEGSTDSYNPVALKLALLNCLLPTCPGFSFSLPPVRMFPLSRATVAGAMFPQRSYLSNLTCQRLVCAQSSTF